MDDYCNRCREWCEELLALPRFTESGEDGEVVTEHVCSGCATRIERMLGRRLVDDVPVLAFVLALTDAIDRLHVAHALRAWGKLDLGEEVK
jgi:hypothetical protein